MFEKCARAQSQRTPYLQNKQKMHLFLMDPSFTALWGTLTWSRLHADSLEGSRVTCWDCESHRSFRMVPGSWEQQWAAHRQRSRSQNHRGGAAVSQRPPQWRPGKTSLLFRTAGSCSHDQTTSRRRFHFISCVVNHSKRNQRGTYSSYGHDDIHCSRSHSDILDIILSDSCTRIYAISIVVDLRRQREMHFC